MVFLAICKQPHSNSKQRQVAVFFFMFTLNFFDDVFQLAHELQLHQTCQGTPDQVAGDFEASLANYAKKLALLWLVNNKKTNPHTHKGLMKNSMS